MRSVLENPEPIKNLASLIKAQQEYYHAASEALSGVLSEVEESAVQAEADYRLVTSNFLRISRKCRIDRMCLQKIESPIG